MTYPAFYDLTDILIGENFEGDKPRGNYTDEQWYYIKALNRYMVETPMDDLGRNLFMTKLMRSPMLGIKNRV